MQGIIHREAEAFRGEMALLFKLSHPISAQDRKDKKTS